MDPLTEYRTRLEQRRATLAQIQAIDARISYGRLVVFAAGVIVAAIVWRGALSPWWLAVPLVVFVALVVYHDRILRRRAAASRAIAYYERGVARIEDRWIGTGSPGDRFRDDNHVYANDLDLFGPGSLFELLSTARTRAGEARLADWLKQPASPSELAARGEAVRELSSALDLREALSLAGDDVAAGVQGEALIAWAQGPATVNLSLRVIPVVLTAMTLASAGWGLTTGDTTLLEIAVVVQSLFAWTQRHNVERALHAADGPARDLDLLSHVLEQLETAHFSSPRLRGVRERLESRGRAASSSIRSLHRLIEMHDWQHNLVFTLVGFFLLWGTHLAWAIEAWRARHGREVATWIEAVADVEALASLGAYRYEHPNDLFPEVIDSTEAVLEGDDLGHPLLPAARMVRNSVHLAGATRLLVVSGSNMSGKSTFLRTVGINTVLALAGAPVRATRLRLTPLAIGATLRIQDSLQEGRSRFYAEITRIRRLSDLAGGSPPLLFLLDELFHGTNSHDRVVGASGVLHALLDRGAIGLITTHDLALTAIADHLAPRAANVHFEDWFEAGELRFDYRMKPGPVTRSNAIALMRAVGLAVNDEETKA